MRCRLLIYLWLWCIGPVQCFEECWHDCVWILFQKAGSRPCTRAHTHTRMHRHTTIQDIFLLSLCREMCLLARYLQKRFNTFYTNASTIQ